MSKLSIEELLEKATQTEKKRRRCENNTNVNKYIDATGWTAGKVAIPTYLIFWHYRMIYKGCHDINKANKTVFFRTFGKKFPSHRKNKQRFYLLNDGIIEVTAENLKAAKAYDNQYWQKKAKTKKTVQLPRQEGNNSNET